MKPYFWETVKFWWVCGCVQKKRFAADSVTRCSEPQGSEVSFDVLQELFAGRIFGLFSKLAFFSFDLMLVFIIYVCLGSLGKFSVHGEEIMGCGQLIWLF